MSIEKAIARAWTDEDYKAKLLSDPHAALADAEHGIDVSAGTTIKGMENSADTVHVALPLAPGDTGEVSMHELEKVAGSGAACYFYFTQ